MKSQRLLTFLFVPMAMAFFWFGDHFAYAQESQPTSQKLSECVAYFTQGGIFEKVIGGVFVVVTVLGMFFRQSLIGLVKDFAQKLLDGKKK